MCEGPYINMVVFCFKWIKGGFLLPSREKFKWFQVNFKYLSFILFLSFVVPLIPYLPHGNNTDVMDPNSNCCIPTQLKM